MKKRTSLAILVAVLIFGQDVALGASFNSVSHIHNIKVNGGQVLLGTHEGLYLYQGGSQMRMLGKENFDVMGLAVSEGKIYASGHPNPGSNLPAPVGLIVSIDNGSTWSQISLQGKVDFHMLEVLGNEIYGADSQSGNLLYSHDGGKTWKNLGTHMFKDISIYSNKPGIALAIDNKKLVFTNDGFKTSKIVKTSFIPNSVDSLDNLIYVSSNKNLYLSDDLGKSWKAIAKFDNPISVVSVSKKAVVVVVGSSILISKDSGKSFK